MDALTQANEVSDSCHSLNFRSNTSGTDLSRSITTKRFPASVLVEGIMEAVLVEGRGV